MPDEPKRPAATIEAPPPAIGPGPLGPPVPQQFTTDASTVSTVYTNFCHVTGTPEELVLDFGLNTQMTPTGSDPIKLTHRVVMNFYTAKRLLNALHFAVSRHEQAFGALELDFQKRARGLTGGPGGPMPAPRPAGPGPRP